MQMKGKVFCFICAQMGEFLSKSADTPVHLPRQDIQITTLIVNLK